MMKMMIWLLIAALLICMERSIVKAQERHALAPIGLVASDKKTTNLIFPYQIVSVDRGSKEVLVQKARNVENVLQVKVATDTFAGSNLTVITADGNLYTFNITYGADPSILALRLEARESEEPVVRFTEAGGNKGKIGRAADWVSVQKPSVKHQRERRYDMELGLRGVYIDEDLLYFQFYLENSSVLNYDIDQLRFSIRDKRQSKRTASQEQELTPLYVGGHARRVPANSAQTLVMVFPKFTIPDKKLLRVQLTEKNGGRHLQLELKYKMLAKARKVKL